MDRDELAALARRARDDHPAPMDVRGRVLAALPRRPAPADRTLLACAAGSLAAAVVMAAFALPAWQSLDEPFAGLFASFVEDVR